MAGLDTREGAAATRRFIRTAMKAPLLAPEREVELLKRWNEAGDEAALSELVKAVGGGSAATVPLVALTLPNVPPKTLVKLAPLLVN